MCKEHQLQWIPLAGYSSQTYLVMSVMSREAGLILIMECRLSWVCATTLGGKNHFCIRHVFELLKQKLQTWEDNVLHLLFHYLTFARITPEDMKPQYTGAKWIEATLKAASIHFVDVWLHLRSQGEPGKRCGATILGIALGAPLEIHHCNSATPSAASIMVCQDRKSFGKKTRVLEAQMYQRYLSCTSCFTQLALIHPHSRSHANGEPFFQFLGWNTPFQFLGLSGKTSFCRCTFALCQSLMHQTPAFLWNEASRTCGGRWFGVKHDIKSHHLGWNRIILLRLQCFDAFLHVPEYIVHVCSCAIFAAERST